MLSVEKINHLESENILLKTIIKNLIEVNRYPDIRINYYPTGFDYMKARAELITCTGEMLVAEANCSLDCKNREYIEENLLQEIGYRFIKRAYIARKNGDVKGQSPNFIYSCKDLKSRGGE